MNKESKVKLQVFKVPATRYDAFLSLAKHTVDLVEVSHKRDARSHYHVEAKGDILSLGLLSVFEYAVH